MFSLNIEIPMFVATDTWLCSTADLVALDRNFIVSINVKIIISNKYITLKNQTIIVPQLQVCDSNHNNCDSNGKCKNFHSWGRLGVG